LAFGGAWKYTAHYLALAIKFLDEARIV